MTKSCGISARSRWSCAIQSAVAFLISGMIATVAFRNTSINYEQYAYSFLIMGICIPNEITASVLGPKAVAQTSERVSFRKYSLDFVRAARVAAVLYYTMPMIANELAEVPEQMRNLPMLLFPVDRL